MGLLIDLHVHTRTHSVCSSIDPQELVAQAVRAGLDGLVITEHQYQWSEKEIAALAEQSEDTGFLLLAGFEYSSSQGDLLIYGLTPAQAGIFCPGLPPEEVVRITHDIGGICVAAHPTRAGLSFDERIISLPVDAIEVCSVNLNEHEQRLAAMLAANAQLPTVAASDAHHLRDVGRYMTEFDDPVRSMNDLKESFRSGRFRPRRLVGTRGTPA